MTHETVRRWIERNYPSYTIVQISRDEYIVHSKRKEKVGLKKKLLGIFPIYEYEKSVVILDDWEYITLTQVAGLRQGHDMDIEICTDAFNKKVYWKYT